MSARRIDTSARPRVAALVLAAGTGSRFGGVKVLARLGDRPLLQHVLDACADAGLADVVVVVGAAADEIEATIAWRSERRVRNPHPDAGLASSLRLGLGALGLGIDAALVLLGDQPLVRPEVIRLVVEAAARTERPIVVPRYATGGGGNPTLVRRAAWSQVDALRGDRGFGPLIADRPDLVEEVVVGGTNPDVDTPDDLAALARTVGAGGT